MSVPTWSSRLAETAAWLAAALAWVVCFASEARLASEHDFPGALALIWPLGLDLTGLSTMFLARDAARRGLTSWVVWSIAAAATAVMVAANILVDAADAIGALMHAVSPVLAVALWYALVHGRKPTAMDATAGERPASAPAAVQSHDAPQSRPARPRRARSTTSGLTELVVARLRERRDALADPERRAAAIAEVALETGAGKPWVRKLASRVESEPIAFPAPPSGSPGSHADQEVAAAASHHTED